MLMTDRPRLVSEWPPLTLFKPDFIWAFSVYPQLPVMMDWSYIPNPQCLNVTQKWQCY